MNTNTITALVLTCIVYLTTPTGSFSLEFAKKTTAASFIKSAIASESVESAKLECK